MKKGILIFLIMMGLTGLSQAGTATLPVSDWCRAGGSDWGQSEAVMTGPWPEAVFQFKFDVSALDPAWAINSVTLYFNDTYNFSNYELTPVKAERLVRNWSSSVAWTGGVSDQGTGNSGVEVGSASWAKSTTAWETMSITPSLVSNWVNGTTPNYGIVLYPTVSTGGAIYMSGTPYLQVEYSTTAAPTFSSVWPYISGPTEVTISSATVGASIYYTTNGNAPTTSGTRYSNPTTVIVNGGDWLQAIAVKEDVSQVTSEKYILCPMRVDLARGHYLLVEKGLQIQAWAFPQSEDTAGWVSFSLSTFAASNFTTANFASNMFASNRLLGAAPGIPWARSAATWFGNSGYQLGGDEMPYLPNMVSYQYEDENDISIPSQITTISNWVALNKSRYPDVISHTNQYGSQNTLSALKNYVQAAKPDMVMFDDYPFNGNVTGGSPTGFYGYMQKYRLVGLSGLDGNGNKPIPYAAYVQTYVRNGHTPSESEIRLNYFSAWAYGYKFVTAFTYNSSDTKRTYPPIMFSGVDDSSPTTSFTQVAETNRQSRNLGPALVRLISTDVRMIMGKHGSSGVTNTTPEGITTGLSETPGYLMSVSATNPGTLNNGKPGDVIVGFFKVLHESFDGGQYNNEKYFMVTNGLSDGNGTAAQTQQQIRLTFDMGLSGITSLQRLSRNTGTVEIVPLTADGNGGYYLDIVLDGGTGDLFKYNTGAPFVGVEEVPAPSLVVSPGTQAVAKEAGTASFTVSNSGTGTMAWTAQVTSGSSWLSISSGSSGTNNGSIVVSFTKNTVPDTSRTATIQITSAGATGSPCTVTLTQSAPALIPGDANKDSAVDVGDLGILAANYGGSNKSWAQGDFNGDKLVDVGDLGILAAHYGTNASSADWSTDYARAFGTTATDADAEEVSSSECSGLGLPLVAGLALMGLMLVKLEE